MTVVAFIAALCCVLIAPAIAASRGVGAQPFGCGEAAVGSLATVTAAGARSRDEIKGPSAVHDEGSRGALVSVRAGRGPARGRDAVALCRRRRTRGARRRPVDQARRRRSRTVRSRRR